METTLAIVKPDGVKRGLIGEILKRYENKGLRLKAAKVITPTIELLEKHYEEHKGKPYYKPLIQYMSSGPVFAMVLEGENAVKIVRLLNGATKVEEALPGTIRGDFAISTTFNIIHGSDSIESAKREIALWFPELA
ncbi:MAG: Nucleoside diphosphate kinase [Caldanaerobacter subterraneus]|jgi:nucleoside-diphosphate kinase|uniref:Nucleoside diphosphate kinase n=4 Tax=Thermoanaerobacter TaxID=1754 RepID=NDK_THEP3|nr:MULTISPECIES: nucleoside-diphosphate kinase [Thermoanaerobacter]B0K4M4.1 RecName: Full=Nucleoside diphosphate kinase; Short=NDK; Short=NDP kinase; AltName: Full=Nucleoside-2-P kinase [Thermoanaerobacter sp. X514]B0KAQ8.1 RecName: Full=Nucleoside diphosphate kinase; Short=NDK; Short=NDP kinase; AltName: Full=Nucleoside-2-P kinase [Thermoanaerobacter pseudethanolicus ATCC 33223]KUJ90116.1 MAG: Nucleoside-diphosphate kinase [Thermoanaerobacter thermocopriae]KUK35644.1 MAG: Nucleoside diphosphat